jgi:hypothetical protein
VCSDISIIKKKIVAEKQKTRVKDVSYDKRHIFIRRMKDMPRNIR